MNGNSLEFVVWLVELGRSALIRVETRVDQVLIHSGVADVSVLEEHCLDHLRGGSNTKVLSQGPVVWQGPGEEKMESRVQWAAYNQLTGPAIGYPLASLADCRLEVRQDLAKIYLEL